MDISVVIPTYNRADLISFTLDSILGQTMPPREVIVIDDGSRDDTPAVLARYGDHIRSIVIPNSGSIVARNTGLRAAIHPLVAFCDSDDLWLPNFLERMATLWRAEPATKVAYANFRIVRDDVWLDETKFDAAVGSYWDGLRRVDEGLGVFDFPIVDRIVRFQPFFQSAIVADRLAILAAGGWDEGVGRTVGDDFGTVLRFGELHPFGIVFDPLVGIRKHGGNFSADTRKMNLGDANILEYALRTRPSLQAHAALIQDSIAARRRDAMDGAFADRDFAAVREIYRLLPGSVRSNKLQTKWLIAMLPRWLARRLANALSGNH
jgi:glycosyltransferase involved in cell wall biosynthesis